jgi:hypothetical protein
MKIIDESGNEKSLRGKTENRLSWSVLSHDFPLNFFSAAARTTSFNASTTRASLWHSNATANPIATITAMR